MNANPTASGAVADRLLVLEGSRVVTPAFPKIVTWSRYAVIVRGTA